MKLLALATAGFWTVPEDISIWDIVNSPVIVALILAPIGLIFVNIITGKDKEIAAERGAKESFEKVLESSNEVTDELLVSPDTTVQTDQVEVVADANRERARSVASKAKQFIQKRMEADKDGRHRRTYEKISGHYPLVRIKALEERDQLNSDQARALTVLFSTWQKYEKGRGASNAVPAVIVELMEREWANAQR